MDDEIFGTGWLSGGNHQKLTEDDDPGDLLGLPDIIILKKTTEEKIPSSPLDSEKDILGDQIFQV